jgi:hypothetical protein
MQQEKEEERRKNTNERRERGSKQRESGTVSHIPLLPFVTKKGSSVVQYDI